MHASTIKTVTQKFRPMVLKQAESSSVFRCALYTVGLRAPNAFRPTSTVQLPEEICYCRPRGSEHLTQDCAQLADTRLLASRMSPKQVVKAYERKSTFRQRFTRDSHCTVAATPPHCSTTHTATKSTASLRIYAMCCGPPCQTTETLDVTIFETTGMTPGTFKLRGAASMGVPEGVMWGEIGGIGGKKCSAQIQSLKLKVWLFQTRLQACQMCRCFCRIDLGI